MPTNTPPPPPSGTAVPVTDYDALAAQTGGIPNAPDGTAAVPVNYDALAAQHGGQTFTDVKPIQTFTDVMPIPPPPDGGKAIPIKEYEAAQQKQNDYTAEQKRESQTRMMLLSGLPGGKAGEDWSNNDKYEYGFGKAVGTVAAPATAGAVLAPEIATVLQAAAKAHPLAAAIIKKGLEGAGFAAGMKWLNVMGNK